MKTSTLLKSLLLGAAAGIVTVAGAQAADLPTKKAAPAAEYVKICTVGGITGFVLPGSDTCMKISGYLTGQTEIGNLKDQYVLTAAAKAGKVTEVENLPARQLPMIGYSTRAQVNFDAVSNTAYGPLAAHIELQMNSGAGRAGHQRTVPAVRKRWRHQQRLSDVGRPHRRQARLVLQLLRRRPVVEGLRVARPQRHPDQPVGLHRLVRRRLRGDPLARAA